MGISPKDKPVVISADNYAKKTIFKYSFVNPKILGLLTVVLLMVIGVGAGVYMTQTPKQTLTQATLETFDIAFKPSEIEIGAGSQFSIDVFGNAKENLITRANLTIIYDSDILELLNISPKQFLPRVLISPKISSGSAAISLGTDGNSGVKGSGILATLSFKSKTQSGGSTSISFDEKQTSLNILGNPPTPLTGLKKANIVIIPDTKTASSSPSSTPSTQAGPSAETGGINFDFNSDEQVNSIDLSVLYSAWGKPESQLQKKADVNSDGIVNGLDYALILPQLNHK